MKAGYRPEGRPPPREPIHALTPPPVSNKPTIYNESYRKESKSVPPRPPVEYSHKLPPINHRANQLVGYGTDPVINKPPGVSYPHYFFANSL